MSSKEYNNRRLIGTKDAAKYLGLHEVTLRKARSSSVLLGREGPKYIPDPRKTLYDIRDLDAWIDSLPKIIVVGSEQEPVSTKPERKVAIKPPRGAAAG